MLPRAPRAAYQAGDPFDRTFAGNYASRGSADRDWLRDRMEAIARTRDVVANEPMAASAVDQKLTLMIGEGWRFESAPDAAVFGLEPASEAYEALASSIEAVWREVTTDPLFRQDYEERLPYELQLDLMARHYVVDGEAFALLPWMERDWWGTSLQVIDPDRVAQPAGLPDSDEMRAGVRFDDRGRPVAYHVLDGHPYDIGLAALNRFSGRWVPRHAPGMPTDTRPYVLHVMRPRRASQTRGVSALVSALQRFQYFRDLTEAELRTRLINAMVIAQYTSAISDADVLQEILGATDAQKLLDMRTDFYAESGADRIAGARILQPFPGDRLDWNSEVRPANAYSDTAAFVAIQCAAPVGLSYELMSRDFSKTTFSSARTSINDVYRTTLRERAVMRAMAVRPHRLAVLQEAYEEGRLAVPPDAPSIWDAPGAYLRGQDIGPGREYVDPVKEAAGDRMEVENLSAAPSDIAARRGQSFEDVIARSARDKRKVEAAGLSLGDISAFAGAAASDPDSDQRRG